MMKKLVMMIAAAVLLCVGISAVIQQNSEILDFIEPFREQAGSVTDNLLSVQDWKMEESYDIDAEDWFAEEVAVLSGSQEYTQLGSGTVNNLVIRAAGCTLEVLQSEDEGFYYSFENMKKVQAYQEVDCIVLNVVRDTQLSEGDVQSVLKLYMPAESILNDVYFELGAGSMNIDNLQAREVQISVDAGNLTMDVLRADSLTVSLGAGRISLKEADLQNGKLSVGAGSMSVEGRISGNVEAECAMGSLQMYLQGIEQDFNYELQCVAGKIQIGEEKYSGINEEKYIDNSAEKNMKLDCAVGNMQLVFDTVLK